MQSTGLKGFALAIGAAILWGVSGTVGQFLFQQKHINVEWLITVRMLVSGVVLLLFTKGVEKTDLLLIWRSRTDAGQLIIFGLAGMLAVQYTYFAAIKHSNAATATVLQYSGPIFIAIFLALKHRTLPKLIDIVATGLAVMGTVVLVTRGHITSLSISGLALFYGLASAVTLAIYTLQPASLLRKFSSSLIIGWGMLVGGMVFTFVRPPWEITGQWDGQTYLGVAFIILFGTLTAFYAYMSAVKRIGGQQASLLASAEPLSATVLAVFWLNLSFSGAEWLGSLCIIATILLLGSQRRSVEVGQ